MFARYIISMVLCLTLPLLVRMFPSLQWLRHCWFERVSLEVLKYGLPAKIATDGNMYESLYRTWRAMLSSPLVLLYSRSFNNICLFTLCVQSLLIFLDAILKRKFNYIPLVPKFQKSCIMRVLDTLAMIENLDLLGVILNMIYSSAFI